MCQRFYRAVRGARGKCPEIAWAKFARWWIQVESNGDPVLEDQSCSRRGNRDVTCGTGGAKITPHGHTIAFINFAALVPAANAGVASWIGLS